jgi:hypothetical protein
VIIWLPLSPAARALPPSARILFELISNFVIALLSDGILGKDISGICWHIGVFTCTWGGRQQP